MSAQDFEKAFEAYLESDVYDRASEAIFRVARTAFQAGYEAAGGNDKMPDVITLPTAIHTE